MSQPGNLALNSETIWFTKSLCSQEVYVYCSNEKEQSQLL